tara:strand:+ start:146 stop:598 length:453 start_codon:yes stop_codon:yes gene_type:complete
MTSTIKVRNLKGLSEKLSRVPSDMLIPLQKQVFIAALSVQKSAIESIQKGSRSGSIYKRGGKSSQRSDDGEFPKTDRGGLVSSIYAKSIEGSNKLAYKVYTKLKYGIWLELGTTKMAARPWLFPAYKANVKEIRKNIRSALVKVLKKAKR